MLPNGCIRQSLTALVSFLTHRPNIFLKVVAERAMSYPVILWDLVQALKENGSGVPKTIVFSRSVSLILLVSFAFPKKHRTVHYCWCIPR